MTKLTKPRLAIAVAVVAASVIGVAAVVLSGGGGSDAPPPPDEAVANYNAYVSVSDVRFEMTTLAPGAVPAEDHGILFVDAASGAGEFWTVPDAAGAGRSPIAGYAVEITHRWLRFDGAPGLLLADRETGATYRIQGWIAHGPTPEGRLILQGRPGTGSGAFQYTDDVPEFVLLTLGVPEETVEFSVPGAQIRASAALLGDGRHAVVSGAVVDAETGEVVRFASPAAESPRHWTNAVGPGAAVAVESGDDEVLVWRFDETGKLQDEWRFDRDNSYGFQISPDGRWLAWQNTLPLQAVPMLAFWPTVTFVDLSTGESVLRAIRVSKQVELDDLQWLSDSSGLVVDSGEGYQVLSPQGGVQPLRGAPRFYAAVPAGRHGVSVDGLPVLTDLWQSWAEAIPDSLYPFFVYGFNLAGDEGYLIKRNPNYADWLLFELNQPKLPPKIQRPPFPDDVRLRVESDEGLNVRAGAAASRPLRGTLSDGAIVTVTATRDEVGDQCVFEEGCAALYDVDAEPGPDAPWWVHVRSEDGLEGWVAAEYLVWAD